MQLFLLLLFQYIYIFHSTKTSRITTKPSCHAYQFNGNFLWKIGKSSDFQKGALSRVLFHNFPICIYRGGENKLIATSDICIHRGASLSRGKVLKNNCLQCPYHGWEYQDGIVKTIPGVVTSKSKNEFGTPRFACQEVNEDVYLCPTFDINSENGIKPANNIFVPPEATDSTFSRISGKRKINRHHSLVTENVLDMMHISFVHSFGNQISPIPFEIKYENIDTLSGKTTFHYNAGPRSMSNIIGGAKFVTVENEFHLPDTTVTRVFAGDLIKTIVTHCYPIGKNESILHYDLYRNFMTFSFMDPLFYSQMDITLREDVDILNGIYDNYIKGFMNTKYDITQLKFREKWNRNFIDENKLNDQNNMKKK